MNRPHGSIAAAQKLANDHAHTNRSSIYYDPPRPEPVTAEQQAANRIARTLKCPEGVAPKFRHLVLEATGEGCAHCGTDSIEIIDQHNRLETTP